MLVRKKWQVVLEIVCVVIAGLIVLVFFSGGVVALLRHSLELSKLGVKSIYDVFFFGGVFASEVGTVVLVFVCIEVLSSLLGELKDLKGLKG